MNEPIVTANKVVAFTHSIRDTSGEIPEYRDLPVTYIRGGGSDLFPEIEAALDGRPVGYKTSVVLTPEQAFGYPEPGLTFTDKLENVPPELQYVGAELNAESDSGEVRHFRVTGIANGELTVDANHPLASGEAAPDLGGLA